MEYKLVELLKFKYGKSQKKVENSKGKYPIYGTSGIMNYADTYIYDKPTVLFGRKGSIEKVQYIEQPFWAIDTTFYTIIDESKVIPQYLFYQLLKINFKDYDEGTTIPSLRIQTLNEITIDIPEIEIQKKILAILSKIDKKIELNNKINDNLLQFGIQRILNNENNKYISLKNLSTVISKGTTPTEKDIEIHPNKDIKFIKVKDFNKFGVNEENIEYIANEIHMGKLKRSVLLKDDLLVSIAGTLGKIAIVTESLDNANTNQAVAFIRLNEKSNRGYLYFYMNSIYFQEEITKRQVHAVQPNLSLTELGNIKVPVISLKYIEFYDLVLNKITQNMEENKRLVNLRDTLLPKLMNGEIDLDKIEI